MVDPVQLQWTMDGTSLRVDLPDLVQAMAQYMDGRRTVSNIWDACQTDGCARAGRIVFNTELATFVYSMRSVGMLILSNTTNRYQLPRDHW